MSGASSISPAGSTVGLKRLICEQARALGFDDCRVTVAAPPAEGRRLTRWLAEGFHGEMRYLERNAAKRLNPDLVLPGTRSMLSLAASYHDGATVPPQGLSGLVARYARFTDYHRVLGERLQGLVRFMDQHSGVGARSLWYVDTGPILERAFAQQSGLGFIGKHTNIISRRLGNWIFLAEILTTLELEPDRPEKNRCGSCSRCLTVCPTEAITAPFQLDARRCISYLTIELKGSIPVELRPAIGNRIYGCDDCLAVCPWNRFAREGAIMRGQTRSALGQLDLVELLEMDEDRFRRLFAGTPLLRSKRRGLLRNVCVALGNIASEAALPALERVARDPEPLVQEHASWAIGRIRQRSGDALRQSTGAG